MNITVQRTPSAVTFIPTGSAWRYLDNGTDQGTAWRARTFNDAAWPSGAAPLGYGDANGVLPTTPLGFGPDANNKYITTYFRRTFPVSNPSSVTNLLVSVQRDDGVIVYLNGTEVFRSNMPVDPIDYLTPAIGAVGGVDETTFYSQPVNPSLLVSGNNVIAVELHQSAGNSSDIILDVELTGAAFPANQGPLVNAGSDRAITLPANTSLSGAVSDDGLPVPPGLLTFGWSKMSGPGTVTFPNPNSLATTAGFSSTGTYVLRLTVGDGAMVATDDVTVTVNGQTQPQLTIDAVSWLGGATPSLRLTFTAVAGQTYTVQRRDALGTGTWSKLADVPGQGTTQPVQVTDSTVTNATTRYYRVVTPQQP
jgi:hypothetical protein